MTNNQSFEEQQTGIFATMQCLMHQIERVEQERGYKFKFKQDTERYYKVIEKLVESFTATFGSNVVTSDSYVKIVAEMEELVKSVKIVKV